MCSNQVNTHAGCDLDTRGMGSRSEERNNKQIILYLKLRKYYLRRGIQFKVALLKHHSIMK